MPLALAEEDIGLIVEEVHKQLKAVAEEVHTLKLAVAVEDCTELAGEEGYIA